MQLFIIKDGKKKIMTILTIFFSILAWWEKS